MKFRTTFGYDVEKASDEATIPANAQGVSMTVQSQAEDADLNVMMERMGVTGKFPEGWRTPTYGDFSGVSDFRSAFEAVEGAAAEFMKLPAKLRARFENDPQMLLDFVQNDANIPEAISLGLMQEKFSGRVQRTGGQAGVQPGAAGAAGQADPSAARAGQADAGQAR